MPLHNESVLGSACKKVKAHGLITNRNEGSQRRVVRLVVFILLSAAAVVSGCDGSPAFAQSLGRYQTCQLQTAQGQAVSGAQVYFLTQPANAEALTPQAQVYSSATGGPVTQPLVTNGFGECSAYLAPGVYTVVYVSSVTGTLVYPDQNVAVGGGTPTSPGFGAITSGANTSAAMVVGSGSSLTTSGAGVIAATAIDGVTVTGTPATGQAIVATSPSAASWQTVSSSGSTTPAQQYDIPYYSANGVANTLAGVPVNGIVKGRSNGAPVAAASIDVANVLQGAANCTAAGEVYSPQANSCLSLSGLSAPGSSADLLYNNAGAVGASAATTDAAGDIVQPNLAMLNHEIFITSSTDLSADLAAAFSASPGCSDSVGTYPHCPNIRVAPGTYNGHTPVTFDTPYMNIRMDGVHLNDTHTTTACLITLTDASDPSPQGPIRALDAFPYFGGTNFFLDGQSAATNSCGIKVVDIFSMILQAGVNYYPGSNSVEVWQQDNLGATERSNFMLQLQPGTGDGLRLSTSGGNPFPTTGYGQYEINCSSGAGTCFHGSSVTFNQNGRFHLICNLNDSATCMKGDTSFKFDGIYSIRVENDEVDGGSATGRNFDGTTEWGGVGKYISSHNVDETQFVPGTNWAIENSVFNDSTHSTNLGINGSMQTSGGVSCTSTFCSFLLGRNSTSNTAIYGIFPSGTVSTSNPIWEIGEWQSENDLTFTCWNGGRVVCGRLSTAGAFSVPGDIQAATGHIGGSSSGNAICTQNGVNCPATAGAAFSTITSGTNTAAAMVIGTGASLTTSGTGNIAATQLESKTWETPGTIGSATPNTATFTSLSSTGSANLSANPGTNGGIAHTFSNTWAAPAANFATVVSEVAPNVSAGGNVQHLLGVSGATNNLLQQFFHYTGSGSTNNYVTSQFFGGNSLLALQAAGNVSVSNAATPCFSQLFAVGSSCQFSVSSAGAVTSPNITDSALTSGQLVKASTGGLLVNAGAIAGAGAGFTTGPTSSTGGNLATFTGSGGQIADSGIAASGLLTLGGPGYSVVGGTGVGGGLVGFTLNGVDGNENIQFTAGSSPSANATVFTTTFSVSRSHSTACTFSPASTAASTINDVYISSTPSSTGYTFSIGSTALTAGAFYAWNFICP